MATGSGARSKTAERILDIAERLVQTRGFNGFSYADISAQLGITKASLHYHFATKDELGAMLITRYRDAFVDALRAIDGEGESSLHKLNAYVKLYEDVLRRDRMCLCGMLAAENRTLSREMQTLVHGFFDANERWLATVVDRGRANGELRFSGPAVDQARLLVVALEGAMLVARGCGEPARFTVAAARLLDQLTIASPPRAGRRSRAP
jgi:TetR/AcrR family transcriptional repressor of nem operon